MPSILAPGAPIQNAAPPPTPKKGPTSAVQQILAQNAGAPSPDTSEDLHGIPALGERLPSDPFAVLMDVVRRYGKAY